MHLLPENYGRVSSDAITVLFVRSEIVKIKVIKVNFNIVVLQYGGMFCLEVYKTVTLAGWFIG